jgi:hypothetical protein
MRPITIAGITTNINIIINMAPKINFSASSGIEGLGEDLVHTEY